MSPTAAAAGEYTVGVHTVGVHTASDREMGTCRKI
jgi:hypothetical protein